MIGVLLGLSIKMPFPGLAGAGPVKSLTGHPQGKRLGLIGPGSLKRLSVGAYCPETYPDLAAILADYSASTSILSFRRVFK